MKLKRWILVGVLCVPAAVILTNGCGLMSGFEQTGSLRLFVTDKPYPYDMIEEALITITEINVRRADSDDDATAEMVETDDDEEESIDEVEDETEPGDDDVADSDEGDDEDEETSESEDDADSEAQSADEDGAWITIMNEERTIDLLDLRNGRMDLLTETTLAADDYTEMRLVVTDGTVKLTDGQVFPLKVPSGEQSGIKLKFHFSVAPEDETVLLLDVDLSRAFQAIPSGHIDDPSTIRNFRFSPAIAMRLINLLDAGSIAGAVTDDAQMPLEAVAVTAFDENGEEVTSTATEADGTYALVGLPTGTYRVEFSAAGFEDATVDDVSVNAGAATEDVDASLAAASE